MAVKKLFPYLASGRFNGVLFSQIKRLGHSRGWMALGWEPGTAIRELRGTLNREADFFYDSVLIYFIVIIAGGHRN